VVQVVAYVQTWPAFLHAIALPCASFAAATVAGHVSGWTGFAIELQSAVVSVVSSGTGSLFAATTHSNLLVLPLHVHVPCCVKFPHWKPTTQM
jgi:hypothetical protein